MTEEVQEPEVQEPETQEPEVQEPETPEPEQVEEGHDPEPQKGKKSAQQRINEITKA